MSSLVRVHLTGGGPSDGRKFAVLKTASKIQEKCVGGVFFWMYLSVYSEDKACIYCEDHPRFLSDSQVPDNLTLWYSPALSLSEME